MQEISDSEKSLFDEAVARTDPAEREAFLLEACPDNELRRRVESLLDAHDEAGNFMRATGNDFHPTSLYQALPEELGTVIGRYKLLEKLGEGGFGTVWVAEQREPVKRRVALKIIKLGMDTRQVIARFEAERQALALMDHPNIAKVLDAGATETGRPYFVMELVRGIPITKYCDQETARDTGSPGPLHEGLPRHPARAPEGDHPPRHQALEHPGHAARRRAGAEGDRLWDRQGDPAGADGEDDLHAACSSSSARRPT